VFPPRRSDEHLESGRRRVLRGPWRYNLDRLYRAAEYIDSRSSLMAAVAAAGIDQSLIEPYIRTAELAAGLLAGEVSPPRDTRSILLEMAGEFEEQSAKLYDAAKVYPLVDGAAPVARVGDEAKAEAYFFGARRLRDRARDMAEQPDPLREQLLALAEELGKEAKKAAADASRAGEDSIWLNYEGVAEASLFASSRIRAIIDEPAALPKPERVEPGQRWRWERGDTIESVVDDDERLCHVANGLYLRERDLLNNPGWLFLGPATPAP
jgi:hypothetical protein